LKPPLNFKYKIIFSSPCQSSTTSNNGFKRFKAYRNNIGQHSKIKA
jgi:hypothetical protein